MADHVPKEFSLTITALAHGTKKPVEYPPDHKPGLRVPKGGSSCASCKYLGKDEKTCTNSYFIRWRGSNKLPYPADEFCSDWYQPKSLKES